MKRLSTQLTVNRLSIFNKPIELLSGLGFSQFWVVCLDLDHMLKRQRSRQGLESLSDEQLMDVGLTRREADTEMRKYFWQG